MKLNKSILGLFAGLISLTACTNNITLPNPELEQPVADSDSLNAFAETGAIAEIKLKNLKTDLITLSSAGLDLFGFNAKNKTIRAKVNSKELEIIKSNKFTYKK